MNVRQYGPALFPSLKQVRSMLDEGRSIPLNTRHDRQTGPAESGAEDGRDGTDGRTR